MRWRRFRPVKQRVLLLFGERDQFILETRDDDTATVSSLMESLPLESTVNRWGQEIYFDAPFSSGLEGDARADMEVGEVAFWPTGSALAIFFGPTPVSTDGRPRAYSECNIVGKMIGDVSRLDRIPQGTRVRMERL